MRAGQQLLHDVGVEDLPAAGQALLFRLQLLIFLDLGDETPWVTFGPGGLGTPTPGSHGFSRSRPTSSPSSGPGGPASPPHRTPPKAWPPPGVSGRSLGRASTLKASVEASLSRWAGRAWGSLGRTGRGGGRGGLSASSGGREVASKAATKGGVLHSGSGALRFYPSQNLLPQRVAGK